MTCVASSNCFLTNGKADFSWAVWNTLSCVFSSRLFHRHSIYMFTLYTYISPALLYQRTTAGNKHQQYSNAKHVHHLIPFVQNVYQACAYTSNEVYYNYGIYCRFMNAVYKMICFNCYRSPNMVYGCRDQFREFCCICIRCIMPLPKRYAVSTRTTPVNGHSNCVCVCVVDFSFTGHQPPLHRKPINK